MGSGRKPSDGLAIRTGFRRRCISMPCVWEQGAEVPPLGAGPGCEGWLPAYTNPLRAAGGGQQLLEPADLGEGLQTPVTFPQLCRELPFRVYRWQRG